MIYIQLLRHWNIQPVPQLSPFSCGEQDHRHCSSLTSLEGATENAAQRLCELSRGWPFCQCPGRSGGNWLRHWIHNTVLISTAYGGFTKKTVVDVVASFQSQDSLKAATSYNQLLFCYLRYLLQISASHLFPAIHASAPVKSYGLAVWRCRNLQRDDASMSAPNPSGMPGMRRIP